jgi:hypothetical protein
MNSYFFVTAKPNACDFFIYHITDQVSCYENHRLNRIKKNDDNFASVLCCEFCCHILLYINISPKYYPRACTNTPRRGEEQRCRVYLLFQL